MKKRDVVVYVVVLVIVAAFVLVWLGVVAPAVLGPAQPMM